VEVPIVLQLTYHHLVDGVLTAVMRAVYQGDTAALKLDSQISGSHRRGVWQSRVGLESLDAPELMCDTADPKCYSISIGCGGDFAVLCISIKSAVCHSHHSEK
jgi:hypothetical protein